MRIVNKKILVVTIIMMLVTCLFLGCRKVDNNQKIKLEEVKLKNDDKSSMFAIMVEQEDGTYSEHESEIWPQKENGYLFNEEKSGCIGSCVRLASSILGITLRIRTASAQLSI